MGPLPPKGAEGALAQGARRAPWAPGSLGGPQAPFLGPGSQALGPLVPLAPWTSWPLVPPWARRVC